MELTSLPAYSLTQPDKTVSSLCAYLVLSLLAPSILWNKMTSSNRQTWETAACVTMLESTGALQMVPTSILSLSKQFNENAVIYQCAENHLSRLAIIPYHVKKELYHLSPQQILSAATHMLWALCVSVTCPSNVGRTPTPMSSANRYQRHSSARDIHISSSHGRWKGKEEVCPRSCRLVSEPGSHCVQLTASRWHWKASETCCEMMQNYIELQQTIVKIPWQ